MSELISFIYANKNSLIVAYILGIITFHIISTVQQKDYEMKNLYKRILESLFWIVVPAFYIIVLLFIVLECVVYSVMDFCGVE